MRAGAAPSHTVHQREGQRVTEGKRVRLEPGAQPRWFLARFGGVRHLGG